MGVGHGHGHAAGRAVDRSRLKVVLAVTVSMAVVEVVGAWVSGSLALLADAGHMLTDAAAVVGRALGVATSRRCRRPHGGRSAATAPRSWPPWSTPWCCWACAGTSPSKGSAGSSTRRRSRPARCWCSRSSALVANAGLARRCWRAQGRVAEHAGRLPRGARRPVRVGARRGRGGRDHGDRVPPRRPARVAGHRGADPAAVLRRCSATPSTCCSRPPRRTWTSTTCATICVGAGRGRRARPARVDDHQRHAGAVGPRHRDRRCLAQRGVGSLLDEFSGCVASHFAVEHVTFQIEPESHRAHEDLGEAHA